MAPTSLPKKLRLEEQEPHRKLVTESESQASSVQLVLELQLPLGAAFPSYIRGQRQDGSESQNYLSPSLGALTEQAVGRLILGTQGKAQSPQVETSTSVC